MRRLYDTSYNSRSPRDVLITALSPTVETNHGIANNTLHHSGYRRFNSYINKS